MTFRDRQPSAIQRGTTGLSLLERIVKSLSPNWHPKQLPQIGVLALLTLKRVWREHEDNTDWVGGENTATIFKGE